MTVFAPADATEMRRLMPLTVDHPGPIYIRQGKGGDPVVTAPDQAFAIGRLYPLRAGRDFLFVTTGTMARTALDAAELLAARGLDAGVVHVPTIKPLDVAGLKELMAGVRGVITLEEHTIMGGLGSAVAEVLAEAGFAGAKGFRRMGIPDAFADKYGSQASLLAHWGLTAEAAAGHAAALAGIQI
jgi:transketolase